MSQLPRDPRLFLINVTQNQQLCENDFNCPQRLPNSYYKGIKPSADISIYPGHAKNAVNRKFFCARPACINPIVAIISLQRGLLSQPGPKHNNKAYSTSLKNMIISNNYIIMC